MDINEERNWCIYKHINKINGKIYIGQAKGDPKLRWGKDGKNYKTSVLFYRAIQKYGWDNFEHEILFTCLTIQEANEKEFNLIKEYETTNPLKGYNIREGGKNGKLGESTKEKLRQINTGKHHSEETKAKISNSTKGELNPFYGRFHSEETKQKMRKNQRNKKGKNNPMYGRTFSEESKEKIRNKKIGTRQSEDTIKKKSKPVMCVETKKCYASSHEAERQTGINNACISACCRGKQKTAGGFHWKYINKR